MMAVFAIPIVALLGTFVYLSIQVVAQAMCEASKHRSDAELKITLAQRGMSAEEIERVVRAKPASAPDSIASASDRQPSSAMPPRKPLTSAS